jgi:hypothetical protein
MIWVTRILWLVIGIVPGFAFGAWAGGLELTSLNEAAKIAPLGTAGVAALAGVIALVAVIAQRDTARRRAAIDFFLKTEMDQEIIKAYERFEQLAPRSAALTKQQGFGKTNADYKALRRWLNICELIAVGINKGAFSERISLDYWGKVLPDASRDAKDFIIFVRQNDKAPETFCELEKLVRRRKWRPRPSVKAHSSVQMP